MDATAARQPPTDAVSTVDFELRPFQAEALEKWLAGDQQGPYRGTLDIATGAGKTLIALAAFARASESHRGLRLAVVVPSEALARQWVEMLQRHTSISPSEVGVLGAGERAHLRDHRVLVGVINSAAAELPDMAASLDAPLMLIVDECHRAGAPTFSRVLRTPAVATLGLSATPDREEFDEDGEPIEYDEHLLGRSLGKVVFEFSLADAAAAGWLATFEIHHHGVSLTDQERREYEQLSRKVDDAAERLERLGVAPSRARRFAAGDGDVARAAQAYTAATGARKGLLYRASERGRVAQRLVERAVNERESPRVLLFHERVAEAEELYRALKSGSSDKRIALEHSRLPSEERKRALNGFRTGKVSVLVSVKSLIEGIDVPAADVGVSVAASSSVRQRIQSLGRVLRRDSPESDKSADMHVIYVRDTVDEVIYTKEDWSDLTGPSRNHYWSWPLDPSADPVEESGPPAEPRPTEEQEWDRLDRRPPAEPERWLGALPDREYSIDTRGTITTSAGALVTNPQDVGEMIMRVRGKPGGRFWVTPRYHLVLIHAGDDRGVHVAGQLDEPFALRQLGSDKGDPGSQDSPSAGGAEFSGPLDKANGTFHLRRKRGGVIERALGRGVRAFALVDDASDPQLADNARRVLEAWARAADQGLEFFVNENFDAWYLERGEPRFLAHVPGGFEWPQNEGSDA